MDVAGDGDDDGDLVASAICRRLSAVLQFARLQERIQRLAPFSRQLFTLSQRPATHRQQHRTSQTSVQFTHQDRSQSPVVYYYHYYYYYYYYYSQTDDSTKAEHNACASTIRSEQIAQFADLLRQIARQLLHVVEQWHQWHQHRRNVIATLQSGHYHRQTEVSMDSRSLN